MEKRSILIIGCGGHGRVVADIARARGEAVVGFLDDVAGPGALGLAVLGPVQQGIDDHLKSHRLVVAIGDGPVRRALAEQILDRGGELAALVHPSAVIAADVEIGAGTVVMAGTVINTGSRIGRFAVVNTGAVLDHDNIVEDNVQISPGCSLAGGVVCREDSFIGTGASLIPKIEVGEGAYVAAGATVIRYVRPHTLVAGCPAVEKKTL